MTAIDPRRLLSVSNPLLAGRDLKLEASGRFSGAPDRAGDRRWADGLIPADYLDLADELRQRNPSQSAKAKGLNFVVSSAVLNDPTSPTQKEYQGHIAIMPLPDGSRQFAAVTTNGPSNNPHSGAKVWLTSPNLPSCLSAINTQLSNKLSGRGSSTVYRLKTGGGKSGDANIDVSDFDRAFREAAGKPR